MNLVEAELSLGLKAINEQQAAKINCYMKNNVYTDIFSQQDCMPDNTVPYRGLDRHHFVYS